MKLPLNILLTPLIKPYYGKSRIFCQNATFSLSVFYTYVFGVLGFLINVKQLKKHLGEIPNDPESMFVHDFRIICTSMGIVQYACLLVGCLTENPALFLPHLAGELFVIFIKILNTVILLAPFRLKSSRKLTNRLISIALVMFNWCQEFCVFRRFLCICDL